MTYTASVGAASVCAPALTEWGLLVSRVQLDPDAGMAELYRVLQTGVRYLLARALRCPLDVDDGLHEVFCIVVKAIQRSEIRDPNALPGFVRTVTKRLIAQRIQIRIAKRNKHEDLEGTAGALVDKRFNPERDMQVLERAAQVRTALAKLSPLDRELLTRFYLDEQSQEDICRELHLTAGQFRNLKSRAKKKAVAEHTRMEWMESVKRGLAAALA